MTENILPIDAFLKEQGFHCFGPDGIYKDEKIVWGNKSLGVVVNQWRLNVHGSIHESYEIEAVFERHDESWMNLRFYSLSETELRSNFGERCRLISDLKAVALKSPILATEANKS